jgi:hypothetical protein
MWERPGRRDTRFGWASGRGWAGQRRPHLSRVGIAADELPRLHLGHPQEGGDEPWFVTGAYPLVELGVSKADEDTILIRHGLSHARKSGWAMCPFQPVGWYWALRETEPAGWEAVVEYERVALARNARMFIVGQAPIAQAVAAWRVRNPLATVEGVLDEAVVWGGGSRPRRPSRRLWSPASMSTLETMPSWRASRRSTMGNSAP